MVGRDLRPTVIEVQNGFEEWKLCLNNERPLENNVW